MQRGYSLRRRGPDMRSGLRTEDRRQWQNGGERDARLIGRKGSTYLASNLKTILKVSNFQSDFRPDNNLHFETSSRSCSPALLKFPTPSSVTPLSSGEYKQGQRGLEAPTTERGVSETDRTDADVLPVDLVTPSRFRTCCKQ